MLRGWVSSGADAGMENALQIKEKKLQTICTSAKINMRFLPLYVQRREVAMEAWYAIGGFRGCCPQTGSP